MSNFKLLYCAYNFHNSYYYDDYLKTIQYAFIYKLINVKGNHKLLLTGTCIFNIHIILEYQTLQHFCTGPAKKFWMTKIQRSCGQKNRRSKMSTVTTLITKEDNQDLYDEKRKLEVINETVY